MRKLALALVLSVLCLSLPAQTIEKTYSFAQPRIEKIGDYQQVVFDGCMQSALKGQPCLPWQSVSLLLPQGTKASSVEMIASNYVELEGSYDLFPYQPSRPYSETAAGVFQKDEKVYASTDVYPLSSKGIVSTQYLNGFSFAFSSFTPVKYVPATGKVSYASEVTIRVAVEADENYDSRMLRRSPEIDRRVCRLAQNGDLINLYTQMNVNFDGYDILVITPQGFVSGFNDYIQFYSARGLRTHVVAAETIYSTMQGVDNKEKIRNYIIQEYMNEGISMVLLGGDIQHVPYRGLYCYVDSGSGYTDEDIPADLYYAALDGSWNTDGDDNWGEIGEEDLLPEVGIARLPFDSSSDLQKMIHKITSYQQNPVLGEFTKTVLAGEHLYDNPQTNGSDYLELLMGHHEDHGYTTDGIPSTYSVTRLYEQMGTWSANNLIDAINAGQQFIHHDGHANYTYVAGWSNGTINNNNFSGADGVNHNYTFFQTSGCMCGGFDQNDCIMEKMVTIDNFAVSVIGNSRYGWFNEGSTEGPSIHLHRETVDALYHERIPFLGIALSEAKIQTAPWIFAQGQWEEGALRWNFYDINVLGDVAVCPWNEEPLTPTVTYFPTIVEGVTSTNVSVTDGNRQLSNFRCSMFKNGQLIGFGMTDETGSAVVEIDSQNMGTGTLDLVVTGPDAFPQSFYVSSINSNISFVIVDGYTIDDGLFDDDNQADNGETFSIDVDFKNIGGLASGNLTAKVIGSDPFVTCTDSIVSLSAIGAGSTLTANAFSFVVADSVPDGHLSFFTIDVSDGSTTWSSSVRFELSAPVISLSPEVRIVDNHNFMLDPGETAQMLLDFSNVGTSVAADLKLYVSFSDSLVQTVSEVPVVTIQPDSSVMVAFTVTVDPLYDAGLATDLIVSAIGGVNDAYGFSFTQPIIIGTMPYIKMGTKTVTTCYAMFTDSRGAMNYSNNEDKTLTFIPSHPGNFLHVDFGEFDTRDTLYVYNGLNTSDSLIGKYIGNLSPFVIDALNADGALTFRFVSDSVQTASGWTSVVTCNSPEPLAVYAYATPVFINPGESSTLTSVVSGGNPLYGTTYQWTPAETLDDPTSPTPVATPSETTTYTLLVACGEETAETSVLVTLGTGVSEEDCERLVAYPNPAKDILNIATDSMDECNYEFVSSLGQVITSGTFVSTTQISTSNLSHGLYFVKVNSNEKVYTVKVVVE